MFNFQRSSISQKLTMISVLSSGCALLLVFVAFALTSVLSHKDDEGKQLLSLAGVIGAAGAAPLLAGKSAQPQAEQVLAALAARDEVAQAALFDRGGRLFALYRAPQHADGLASPEDLDPALLADMAVQPVTQGRHRSRVAEQSIGVGWRRRWRPRGGRCRATCGSGPPRSARRR